MDLSNWAQSCRNFMLKSPLHNQALLDKFSLTRSLFKNLTWPAFEQLSLLRKNLPICVVHMGKLNSSMKTWSCVWSLIKVTFPNNVLVLISFMFSSLIMNEFSNVGLNTLYCVFVCVGSGSWKIFQGAPKSPRTPTNNLHIASRHDKAKHFNICHTHVPN